MDTPNLYYSPGACSLAPHIVLEEIGAPFTVTRVAIADNAHLSEGYGRVHPLHRVPALVAGGFVLTEVSAILHHLADLHSDRELAPPLGDPRRARSYEWASFLGTSVHVAFAQIWRGARFTTDEQAWSGVRDEGLRSVTRFFRMIESKLGRGPFALGERYGVIDPYLLVMHRWGCRVGLAMNEFPLFLEHARRVAERPATRRAGEREGIRFDG